MTSQPAPTDRREAGGTSRPARPGDDGTRLRLRLNPLRLLVSAGPWTATWYLLAYILMSWVLFAVALTATATAAAFAITLAGIPLLVGAAGVVRGCANAERRRLHQVFTEPVRGEYRAVARPGLLAQVSTRWKDRETWRDAAYIIGLWLPLCLLDTIVISVRATLLAGLARVAAGPPARRT